MALANIPYKIKFFVHPIPLTAVAVMALNDHWGKYAFPGILTGKLSDFCGVFYLPILMLALIVAFDELFGVNKFRLSKRTTIVAILFTDFLMVLVKLSPASARAIEAFFANYLFQIQLIQDPTDLTSLLVNPLTYLYLRRYWMASKET
ncbi:hypothetical protein [Bdellovibrio sp. HCB337]|uniref:hypothetical protein n=1 Tax=Bdellovibrio sp. HCB337 TaxID=3394358 RepID=UPI0039A491C1